MKRIASEAAAALAHSACLSHLAKHNKKRATEVPTHSDSTQAEMSVSRKREGSYSSTMMRIIIIIIHLPKTDIRMHHTSQQGSLFFEWVAGNEY